MAAGTTVAMEMTETTAISSVVAETGCGEGRGRVEVGVFPFGGGAGGG